MASHHIIKPLPFELHEQVRIYFEEGLLQQGLDFLTSLLTSGVSSPNSPIFIPTPSLLSLVATLSIHPNFTNRAKDPRSSRVSLVALQYLKLLNEIVSPAESHVLDAFTWQDTLTLTRRGGFAKRQRVETNDENGNGGDQDAGGDSSNVRSPYARDRSVFTKSADFWALVGWAFRCSVLHPTTRWPAWVLFIEQMLETLEQDLNERFTPDSMAESLIARYVGGPEKRPRILRAVFAADSERAGNDFPALWKNETKIMVKAERDKKDKVAVKKIDLETDDFGDYLDVSTDDEKDDDEQGPAHDANAMELTADPVALRKSKLTATQSTAHEPTSLLGGHAATKLRLRLLGILARLSAELPIHFGSTWSLSDLLLDHLKPLPLPAFTVMLSPPMLEPFPEDYAVSLLKFYAETLLPAGAKASKAAARLDQEVLIAHYLPMAAHSSVCVDNAKLSVCLEGLLRMLDLQRRLRYTEDLEMAVEKGIQRREAKATAAKGKKGEANGERDMSADKKGLADSSMRLRMLVHLVKMAGERRS